MTSDAYCRRILELSLALEITKTERESLKAQTALLTCQLDQAARRAEAAEERLHETTKMLWALARDALAGSARSVATKVMVDGRSVLRLSNPIERSNTIDPGH